ncbi:MAG: hypothetical protein JXR83_08040 [Deltaproteobacteria bacterium]|nr:hypothetical protein [Deltaproteobacteria bacterium]
MPQPPTSSVCTSAGSALRLLGRLLESGEADLAASADDRWRERSIALEDEERRCLAAARTCLGCESCNAVCPLVAVADAAIFDGPMAIASRLARGAPDFGASAAMLRVFDRCGQCRACEQCCPQQIPILELVRVMRAALARRQADRAVEPEQHERRASDSEPG